MKKKKKNDHILEQVKASRKASREEEILMHGKPIRHTKIAKSKKFYDRKRFFHGEPFIVC